jgi:hypothetical protein
MTNLMTTSQEEKSAISTFPAVLTVTLSALVSMLCVGIPLYVIRPFRPQGPHELAFALAIRQAGPWLAAFCTLFAVIAVAFVWSRITRLTARIGLVLALLVACAGAVLTHVNIFERMFHPYDVPAFDTPTASKIEPDDMVMAVQINGEARAYPIRAMGYHHIVNDTVGGLPIAATYCTLCHTGLVWSRVVDGKTLHFRLAGINNGNALMRDEQTSTIWQQTTGRAIFGPLKGHQLEQLHSDELSFALWRREQPRGMVLRPDPEYASLYESKQWEQHIARYGSVVDTTRTGIKPRELMIGISAPEASKAYPYQLLLNEKLIQDRVGTDRVLLIVGPDNLSVRAFLATSTFIRQPHNDALMTDTETRSQWNFQGCAISGRLSGHCLTPTEATKDYWFDWLNYHRATTVYKN